MSWSYQKFKGLKGLYWHLFPIAQQTCSNRPAPQIQAESLEERVLFDAAPLGDLFRAPDAGAVDAAPNDLLGLNFDSSIQEAYSAGLESLDFDELSFGTESDESTLVSLEQLVDSLFTLDNVAQTPPLPDDSSDSTQLIVVDGSIEGLQELLADLGRFSQSDAQVLILDSQRDGLAQISQWLSQFSRVSEIHLFVHADGDQLQLGSTSVSLSSVANFSDQWMNWNHSLADGTDLLIYGCDLASTESGRTLIEEMARWTGLDIAASDDLTGTSNRAGNWRLEYQFGDLSSASIFEGVPDHELAWRGVFNLVVPDIAVAAGGNLSETSSQNGGSDRAIAMHSDGSFVLVWSEEVNGSNDWDVFARRFAANGTPTSSTFQVNQYTDKEQQYAAIGMDNAGNFVITWTSRDQDGNNDGVFARRFAADGTALSNEFQVNTETNGVQTNSSVAVRGDGSFVIVWEGAGSSDQFGIFGQRFDASGGWLGSNFWVNSVEVEDQSNASISINSVGNFAVSWDDANGYHFQRFDSFGVKIGGPIQASSLDTPVNGSILLNDDNSLAATWQTNSGTKQTWLRVYDSANGTSALPILVNSPTATDNQKEPSISGTGSGNFVITWEGESSGDNGNIFARYFNADGSYASSVFVVNDQTSGTQTMSSVATNASVVFAWTDAGDGAQDQGVYVRLFGDAPVLDTQNSPVLNPVDEGSLNSQGTLISDLLPPGSVTQNSGPASYGIAIVALDTEIGTWQFSTDNGGTWINIDVLSINSQTNELALLLGPTARIRLVPFADMNGTLSDAITFRAWDLTNPSIDNYLEISNPGIGVSPFSLATETAAITITPVNDAPVFETGVGYAVNALGDSTFANAMAQQVDGKSLVTGRVRSGSGWDVFVTRYNYSGSLDTSFGINGSVVFGFGSTDDWSNTLAVQSDGKIVIGGQTMVGGFSQQAIARLNPDGTFDASFGSGGVVINAVGAGNHEVRDLRILSDGKILFVGATVDGYRKFTAVQLNSDGSLNTSFGTNGVVVTDLGSAAYGRKMELQADGKILLGGHRVISGVTQIAVVRYHADGTLDSSFGVGGVSSPGISTTELNAMRLLSDGRILIGATFGTGTTQDFAIFQLDSDGSLDGSFQSTGYRILDLGFDDELTDLIVQPEGSIILVGSSVAGINSSVSIVKLNEDGSSSLAFGINGRKQIAVGSFAQGNAAWLQPDGKLMIAGAANPNVTLGSLLLRLDESGNLSNQFATSGNLGGTHSIEENGSPVILDANVEIMDVELLAAGSYAGSQLSVHRDGGANVTDVFSASGNLGALTQGGDLTVGGNVIGTVTTNSLGTLLLTFNANATPALVNQAIQQIAFKNTTATEGSTIQIALTFNDGNQGAQGIGGSLTANGIVSFNVVSSNTAPVLAPFPPQNFASIDEDSVNNSGQTIREMLDADACPITDSDSGAVEGIAITGWNAGNGRWQYSIDAGGTWLDVGTVSESSALLLRESDRIRFVPNGENGTTADITFRAWDQTGITAGLQGTKLDSTLNGGTRAFSTATAVATIVVSDVNDAPVLDNSGSMTLTTIDEDQIANLGDTISAIINSAGGNRITDVDSGAVEGIAVTGLNSGNGQWEYSLDNGASWTGVGTVSETAALLLRAEDRLRFVPDGQNGTTASFTFRAWDQAGSSSGLHGNKVDILTSGGSSSFSVSRGVASIAVIDQNDAPIISIQPGDSDSAQLTETDSSLTYSGTMTVTDVDLGESLTANVTAVAVSGVTLGLSADQSELLTMLTTDAHILNPPQTPGHIHWLFDSRGEAFDYLAAGEVLELSYTVEVTDSKGSKASQIVTIQVMGSNDAPKILVAPGNKDGIALDETNSSLSASGSIAVTDADLTQGVLGTIKSVSILGDSAGWNGDTQKIMAMLQVNPLVVSAGNSVGLLSWSFDSGNESFDFLPKGAVLYLDYTVEITDSLASFDQQISIQIVGTNDAPNLKPGASSVLTGAPETGIQLNALVGISDAIKDVDHGSGWGLVLTSSDGLGGGWQYRINGANEWFAIETATVDRGTLLRSSDFIRFISNSGDPSSGSLDIRAWDLSFGAAGSSVNLSDLEQQSAISSNSGELLANIASVPANTGNNADSSSNTANTKTDPKNDTKSVTRNDSRSDTQSETKSGSEVTVSNSETASDNLGIGGNQSSTVPDQNTFVTNGDQTSNLQQLTEELRVSETKLNLDLIGVATAPSKSDNYYRLITNAKEQSLELGEAYVFAQAKPTYLDNELIWTRFFEGLNESSRELLINQDELGVPHFVASTASLLTFGYLAWVVRGGVLLTTFMSSLPTWKALDILPLIENSGQDKETIEQIVDSKVTA